MEALMTGWRRSASTTVFAMNAMNVNLAPRRSYSAFFAWRIFSTVEKFTWNTEWTCADVRRLRTMCSAIFLRITDIGWMSTRSPVWYAGTFVGAGDGIAGAGAGA